MRVDRSLVIDTNLWISRLLMPGGIVRVIPITRRIAACRDPKDDKFLDVALGGDAQAILTGDENLLSLHPFHGIDIVRPAAFLDWPLD